MGLPNNRWAWAEIDLGALRRNAKAFKAQLARGVKFMAIVKADAYGHGAAACAKALRSVGADQFGVATVDEGIALRQSGIEDPILVLNQPPLESIDDLVTFDLMPSIYEIDFALGFGEASSAAGKVGKYHLAIDSGMTRIGVRREEALELRRAIDFHRGLECAGTFTHFATADLLDDWDFALQVNRFTEAVSVIHEAGLETGLVHADNTPGTILHPDVQFDMCRIGIGLYGLHPAENTVPRIALEPVMSVRGRVTRAIYPKVATVPIGYADGLARCLSNRMDVLVDGMRVRQVGNICMDQFMFAVDINRARSYRPGYEVMEGDMVTIMGADGDEYISADEIAKLQGTINYEVVCDFGMRLDKVYL